MTQFVPYVEGTAESRRRNAAALALLKTSPAGTVIVVDEVPREDVSTQRKLGARATRLGKTKSALEANVRFHTVQDPARGVVRLLGTKSGTGDAPTVTVTAGTLYVTEVKSGEITHSAVGPVADKRTYKRATKAERDVSALNRALSADGRLVSVATYPVIPGAKATVEDQRRKAERRRVGLNRAAKEAGVKLVVRVRTTDSGVHVSARTV